MTAYARLWPLLIAVMLAPAAQAQDKVWRCGPEGREYSPTPCPGGREVPVADPRSAEQQRAAREVADREAGLADQLRKERRAAERQAARQRAAGIEHDRRDKLAKAESKPKAKKKSGKFSKQASQDAVVPFTARGKPAP
jgi:hypothetical protein